MVTTLARRMQNRTDCECKTKQRGSSSVGRAQPCQGWGRGFESRLPLTKKIVGSNGGIGRHEGLKIPWPVMAVRVQVPLRVHSTLLSLHIFKKKILIRQALFIRTLKQGLNYRD